MTTSRQHVHNCTCSQHQRQGQLAHHPYTHNPISHHPSQQIPQHAILLHHRPRAYCLTTHQAQQPARWQPKACPRCLQH
jgi:hypothetical protein